jgi:hypothetical protein
METKEIISTMLKNGATMFKDVTVKNVTLGNYQNSEQHRLSLTLDKEVDGMVANGADADGVVTYTQGKTNVVFTSVYSIGAVLKDDEDAAFAVNTLTDSPKGYQVVLSRAKVDIICEKVKGGTDYKNPWSSRVDANVTHFDHDTILFHVVNIKLSDRARMLLDRMAMQMLGL